MTITLSDGITTLHPFELRASYASKRASGNIGHQLAGGGYSATLAAAQPRTGTLQFKFDTEADSLACENLLKTAKTFTIADTNRTSFNMTFILAPGGTLARTLDPVTAVRLTVNCDYQEIS